MRETQITPDGRIFSQDEWDELAEQVGMSPRQAQIAAYLLEGLGDKQIAKKLGIAVPTIRTHLGRLFTRMNVQDRNELVLHLFRLFRAGCWNVNCPRRL